MAPARPGRNCPRCPRLVALRQAWRAREPGWFNAPGPAFGPREARLAIIGLAPGLRGANRTGRPFTGDFAGGLLHYTLADYRIPRGRTDAPEGVARRAVGVGGPTPPAPRDPGVLAAALVPTRLEKTGSARGPTDGGEAVSHKRVV